MYHTILAIIRLLRPWQWYKSLFVLLAPFLLGIEAGEQWVHVLVAFIAVSLASSANYVLNDIRDSKRDSKDPERAHRPLASGLVSPWLALLLYAVLAFAAIAVGKAYVLIILSLLVLGALYTYLVKGLRYVELILIGLNYVLRTAAGAFAIGYTPVGWLYAGAFSLALFVVTSKRYASLPDVSQERGYARVLNALILLSGLAVICIPSWFAYTKLLPSVIIPLIGVAAARYYYVTLHQRKAARHPHLMFLDFYTMLPSVLLLIFIALHVY